MHFVSLHAILTIYLGSPASLLPLSHKPPTLPSPTFLHSPLPEKSTDKAIGKLGHFPHAKTFTEFKGIVCVVVPKLSVTCKLSCVDESKKSHQEPTKKSQTNSKVVPWTLRSRNAGQKNEDKENFGKGK